jgi:hypothetical protein
LFLAQTEGLLTVVFNNVSEGEYRVAVSAKFIFIFSCRPWPHVLETPMYGEHEETRSKTENPPPF